MLCDTTSGTGRKNGGRRRRLWASRLGIASIGHKRMHVGKWFVQIVPRLDRTVLERCRTVGNFARLARFGEMEMANDEAAARLKRARALYRKTAKNPRTVDDFLSNRRAEEARRDAVLSRRSGD